MTDVCQDHLLFFRLEYGCLNELYPYFPSTAACHLGAFWSIGIALYLQEVLTDPIRRVRSHRTWRHISYFEGDLR